MKKTEKELSDKKSTYEMTQEQLADIYFAGAGGKSHKSDVPIVIKVVERPKMASLIPWVIASIAFLITAFSLFSTKRVFIDVRVIDDKHLFMTTAADRKANEPPIESADRVDKVPLQDFFFEGAAKLKSSKEKTGLMLVNSSVAPFARASVLFDPPLDLRGAKIVFQAKGLKGGEDVAVAMKDSHNVQAFSKGKAYPFPDSLTAKWQWCEISGEDLVPAFDRGSAVNLRFEFGSKDTENKSGDTLFIKDLQIVRRTRKSATNE